MVSVRVNRRQRQSIWGLFKQVWYQTVACIFLQAYIKYNIIIVLKVKLLSPEVEQTFFL